MADEQQQEKPQPLTLKFIVEDQQRRRYSVHDVTSFTCYDCPLALPHPIGNDENGYPTARVCPWAWDPYNTNGDCLADK